MTAESCILADQLTLSLPGGRLCPKHFCPPSIFFFKTSSIPVLYFCSFRYKDPRILPILIKASIAHLVERLTPDLKVPGSIPGGGSFFFIKVRTTKLQVAFLQDCISHHTIPQKSDFNTTELFRRTQKDWETLPFPQVVVQPKKPQEC